MYGNSSLARDGLKEEACALNLAKESGRVTLLSKGRHHSYLLTLSSACDVWSHASHHPPHSELLEQKEGKHVGS